MAIVVIDLKLQIQTSILLSLLGNGESENDIDPEIFKEFENKLKLQEALGETPLAKNPFFLRSMGDPVFTGNGTEGVEPGNKIFLHPSCLLGVA